MMCNKIFNRKLLFSFLFVFTINITMQDIFSYDVVYASSLSLPAPNVLLKSSGEFSEPVLLGLRLDKNDPFKFEFILDSKSVDEVNKAEVDTLIKYFFAGLSMPKEKLWVNLSPYEKDRVIDENLEKTELGKDILVQDYILKQFSSSLTDPTTPLGKSYWSNESRESQFDNSNKIWISAENAEVFVKDNLVLITDASLKVETESEADQILLPKVTYEVNNGADFSKLRQIYHSLILAQWFKQSFINSIYKSYINSEKTRSIAHNEKEIKKVIFDNYVQSFKDGVYSKTLKEKDQQQQLIKRKYFSGGVMVLPQVKQRTRLAAKYDNLDSVVEGSSAIANVEIMSSALKHFKELNELDIKEENFGYFTELFLKSYIYSGNLDEMPIGTMANSFYYNYNNMEQLINNMIKLDYLEQNDHWSIQYSPFKVKDKAVKLVTKFILSANYIRAGGKQSVSYPTLYSDFDGSVQRVRSFDELLNITREKIEAGLSFRVSMHRDYKRTLEQLYEFLKDLPQELRLLIFEGNDNLNALKYLTVDYYSNREKIKLSSLSKDKSVGELYQSLTSFDKRKSKSTNQGTKVFEMLLSKYDIEFDISPKELSEWLGINQVILKNYSIADYYTAKKYKENVDKTVALPIIDSVPQQMFDIVMDAALRGLESASPDEFEVWPRMYSSENNSINQALSLFYKHGYLNYLRNVIFTHRHREVAAPVVSLGSKFAIHLLEHKIVETEIDFNSTSKHRLAFMHHEGKPGAAKAYEDLYSLLLDFQLMISEGKKVVIGLSNELKDELLKIKPIADTLEEGEQELLFKRLGLKSNIFEAILNHNSHSPFPESLSELIANNDFDQYWDSLPDAYQSIYRTNSSSSYRFWDLLEIFADKIKFDVTYEEARSWCGAGQNLRSLVKLKKRFKGVSSKKIFELSIEEVGPKKDKVVFAHKGKGDYELLSLADAMANYSVNDFNDMIPDSFSIETEWDIARKVVHFLVASYQSPFAITDHKLAGWLGVDVSTMTLYFKEAMYERKNQLLGENIFYSDIFKVTKYSLKKADKNKAKELLEQINISDHPRPSLYMKDALYLKKPSDIYRGIDDEHKKLYSVAGDNKVNIVALRYLLKLYKNDISVDYEQLANWANIEISELIGTVLKDDINIIAKLFDNYRTNALTLSRDELENHDDVYWFSEHSVDTNKAYEEVLSYYELREANLRELDPILFDRSSVDQAKFFVVTETNALSFLRIFDFLYYINTHEISKHAVVGVTNYGAKSLGDLKAMSSNKKLFDVLSFNYLMPLDEALNSRSMLDQYGSGEFQSLDDVGYYDFNEASFTIPGIINKYIETNFSKKSSVKFLHYLFMTRNNSKDLDINLLSNSLKMSPQSIIDFIGQYYPAYEYLVKAYLDTPMSVTKSSSKLAQKKRSIDHDILYESEFSPLVEEVYQAYLLDQDVALDPELYGAEITSELIENIVSAEVDGDRRLSSLDLLNYWLISANYDEQQIYDVYSSIFENLEYDNEFMRELLLRIEFLEGEEFTSIYKLAYSMFEAVKLKPKMIYKRMPRSDLNDLDPEFGGVDFNFAVDANSYQLPDAWHINNGVDLSNIDFVVSSLYSVDSLSKYLKMN